MYESVAHRVSVERIVLYIAACPFIRGGTGSRQLPGSDRIVTAGYSAKFSTRPTSTNYCLLEADTPLLSNTHNHEYMKRGVEQGFM